MDWFHFQDQGEDSATWHWADGDTAVYTDANGKPAVARNGHEYLAVYEITGTNDEGAATGTVTVFHQNEAVVRSSAVFSGGNVSGTYYEPIVKSTYYMRLGIRDIDGPNQINEAQNNPVPFYGIQLIPYRGFEQYGIYWVVQNEWGAGRIYLNHPLEQVDPNKWGGNYLHGKFAERNTTHGCACDKTEAVFNYLWRTGFKGTVPFWVK